MMSFLVQCIWLRIPSSSVAILMTGHKGSFWITAHEFTDLIKGACIGDNIGVIVNTLYR